MPAWAPEGAGQPTAGAHTQHQALGKGTGKGSPQDHGMDVARGLGNRRGE